MYFQSNFGPVWREYTRDEYREIVPETFEGELLVYSLESFKPYILIGEKHEVEIWDTQD